MCADAPPVVGAPLPGLGAIGAPAPADAVRAAFRTATPIPA